MDRHRLAGDAAAETRASRVTARSVAGNRSARRLDGAGSSSDGSPVTGSTAEARAQLPVALADALDAFEEHLCSSRGLSEHTVRGYVGDVVRLLDHLARRGGATAADLDLATLRSWLAQGRTRGHSRATTARHAASASPTRWTRRRRSTGSMLSARAHPWSPTRTASRLPGSSSTT